jgi:hypothetical protein
MVFDIFGNINGPEVWTMKYGLWRKIYGTRRAQVSLSHPSRCPDDETTTHLGNGDPQRFHLTWENWKKTELATEALVPHFSFS